MSMSYPDPFVLGSDFSGLAFESLFVFVLVLMFLVASISVAIWVLKKWSEAKYQKAAKKTKSIYMKLAWLWLVVGSLGVFLITGSPFHELLFSRSLRPAQSWPSLFITLVGIVLCLLAMQNAIGYRRKRPMWLLLFWFGYLAVAMGLSIVRG